MCFGICFLLEFTWIFIGVTFVLFWRKIISLLKSLFAFLGKDFFCLSVFSYLMMFYGKICSLREHWFLAAKESSVISQVLSVV